MTTSPKYMSCTTKGKLIQAACLACGRLYRTPYAPKGDPSWEVWISDITETMHLGEVRSGSPGGNGATVIDCLGLVGRLMLVHTRSRTLDPRPTEPSNAARRKEKGGPSAPE